MSKPQSPLPWTAKEFGYERIAILDANGAEVAEVVRIRDAECIVSLVNAYASEPANKETDNG